MPHLHEPEIATCAVERAEQSVDAVARVAEDGVDAPFMQSMPEEVAHCLAHDCLPTC